tara:strand:- start:1201 stop:1881 length:681 start_codon:yes stop_codon:yes gene_type:complete
MELTNIDSILETSQENDYFLIIVSLIFCTVTSFILMYVYKNKSNSLSSKVQISPIIPLLSLITFLVILIVKSSLALSLGLVGALSVIRFRTPIKEPEDLAFLFLAIGIGIGYGAGQIYATTIIFLAIISIIWFILSNNSFSVKNDFNFIVETSDENKEKYFEELLEVLKNSTVEASFVKFEQGTNAVIIYYRLVFDDVDNIQKLINDVNRKFSGIKFSLYENKVID